MAPGWVLITGACGGLGSEAARRLAGRGHSLLLLDRSAGRLAELRDHLRCPVRAEALDLSHPSLLPILASRMASLLSGVDGGLDGALLLHGHGVFEPFGDRDAAGLVGDVCCNADAFQAIIGSVVGELERAGAGGFIAVASSCLALVPAPFASTYCAEKALLREACLRMDGWGRRNGVTVVCTHPSPIRGTGFFSRPEMHGDAWAMRALQHRALSVTPGSVIDGLLGICCPEGGGGPRGAGGVRCQYPGWVAKACLAAGVVVPGPLLRLAARALGAAVGGDLRSRPAASPDQ